MKDKSKSKKTAKRRKSFSQSLPGDYPWKILGWLSEDLRPFLSDSDYFRITTICRNRDIDGYLELSKAWGLQCMLTTGCATCESVARYQLASLLKKFRFNTEREARVSSAIEKFLAGEERCKFYNREGYMNLLGATESWMVGVYTHARSFMQKLLGFDLPDPSVMTERSRHGPGATLDTDKGCVSSYFKYAKWPYQCTLAAFGYARSLIEADERWLGALEDDYRRRYEVSYWAILDRQKFWHTVLEVVDGNRITFVPKDARVERSIAIEPTLNLYLQLGVDGFIRRRLKRWGVDLDHQEKNQRLAYLGSIETVDPYVTIDLANASNSISLKLCKALLPECWYNYLIALRSPVGDLKGQTISYEMISSMGNGYTFALESAIFTSIVYGVMKETSGSFKRDEFAVYGDDIIVRQSISSTLIEALTNCGFEINVDKSFLDGSVRESCGTDWFQGIPVRPVFLHDIPSEVDELLSDLNRLKRILSLRWGLEESLTWQQMAKWIPEQFRDLFGPLSDQDFDSYIHSESPKVRYRRCVYKYRRLIRKPIKVKAPSFHFRKLMCDLHPIPLPPNQWEKRKLTGSGGRFSVYRRSEYTLSTCYSVASDWRSEYDEFRPAP